MKIGVLGGGLSGLVFAGRSSHDTEILEADSRLGGHCQSLVQDGYTFDVGGPHILFSKNQEILDQMVARLGDNIDKRRRANVIYFKGNYVKYPFENGLYDLEPQDRFECLYHYLNNDHPEPSNFKEWIYHNFGSGIADKYMLPYNEKIWNIGAEHMSFDWVEGRVPKPPVEDVIKSAVGVETEGNTHQLYFYYPKAGGIESLPLAYAADCGAAVTDFKVTKVSREEGSWQVGNGARTHSYDKLVSTIPVQSLIRALPDVPIEVSDAVANLKFNSLSLVMLGAGSDAPPPYTAIYVPEKSYPFHRLSFPLNFTDAGAPRGRMAVAAEITTNPGDGIHELDDENLIAETIDGLVKMNLIDPAAIEFRSVYRTEYAYVVRTFEYEKSLSLAHAYLEELGITSLGRNAEFEYINMDEAVRRGLAAADGLE